VGWTRARSPLTANRRFEGHAVHRHQVMSVVMPDPAGQALSQNAASSSRREREGAASLRGSQARAESTRRRPRCRRSEAARAGQPGCRAHTEARGEMGRGVPLACPAAGRRGGRPEPPDLHEEEVAGAHAAGRRSVGEPHLEGSGTPSGTRRRARHPTPWNAATTSRPPARAAVRGGAGPENGIEGEGDASRVGIEGAAEAGLGRLHAIVARAPILADRMAVRALATHFLLSRAPIGRGPTA
jgi:hypothetical protein